MDFYPYLIVGVVTSVLAGAITLVGDRAGRAAERGVSKGGLIVGALLGGTVIAGFDLLVAFLLTLVWARVVGAAGGSPLPLLTAFIAVAVAHIWATTALSWRRWQADPVRIDRDDGA